MIPAWKIKREMTRMGYQLRAIPEAVWEPFASTAHEAAFDRGFPTIEGRVAIGPKVALVLCWQPKGMAESFLDTLDHLIEEGYAPFVVSNSPLSDADRASLQSRVWRAIERPNFGYDFGGYRDGLRLLRQWNVHPDRLVILNDSIWFPLWPEDKTLQRAEASPFDVTGTILRHRDGSVFLESYFFSIRGAVLGHPAFRAFWDTLRLTSNKYKVIRRGERGFGHALQAAGISIGPLFKRADFESIISDADEKALRQALYYMAAVDPQLATDGATLANATSSPEWTAQAREFIAQTVDKSQFYSTFPITTSKYLGYPMLKKSAEPVSAEWRAAFLRGIKEGALPDILPSVWNEALRRTKDAVQ